MSLSAASTPGSLSSSDAFPPLRVAALVKRFGQVTAVDGITLELRSGECLGLLGPNGAGKSTLIRSIVGRVIPDAGTISVFGAPADSVEARNALGWIPQELALYPRLTCRENLQAFGRYHGHERRRARSGRRALPGLGDAHRSCRRTGQESFGRHEATAQHGRRHDSSAEARSHG